MIRRRVKTQTAAIDMSPLMDLTFMLLIIFVITVPSMYYKSDVQLTPPEATTNEKMEVEENSVFVELDNRGEIWLGTGSERHTNSFATPEDLTQALMKMKETKPNMVVYLVGDRERQYKEVIHIANAVQKANINTLSLVFNPDGSK